MFAEIERRRDDLISKLHAKHPKQSREAAEDAFENALAFFCEPENRQKIKGTSAPDGLVFQRADWLLSNEWRRQKKHIQLDSKRDREASRELASGEKMDLETFLAGLPVKKRDLVRMRLEGYTFKEIAQKLGVKNNSSLRMQISRLIEDFKKEKK